MIDSLLNDGYYVSVLSDYNYKKQIDGLEKQIKGHSKYDDYSIIEYLPKNKEFYVVEDNEVGYENGYEEYDFSIAITYKGMYFIITDSGSN